MTPGHTPRISKVIINSKDITTDFIHRISLNAGVQNIGKKEEA
jgi:hypothetical protein